MKIIFPILTIMSLFWTVSTAYAQEIIVPNPIKINISTGLAILLGTIVLLYLVGLSLYIFNNRELRKSRLDFGDLDEQEILVPSVDSEDKTKNRVDTTTD